MIFRPTFYPLAAATVFFVFGPLRANERIDILLENPTISGGCPARVHFAGRIHPYAPGPVVYKFVRSDGANSPEHTLEFPRPEAKPISFDWQLGKSYSGWVQLVILSPNREQTAKRTFQVRCP